MNHCRYWLCLPAFVAFLLNAIIASADTPTQKMKLPARCANNTVVSSMDRLARTLEATEKSAQLRAQSENEAISRLSIAVESLDAEIKTEEAAGAAAKTSAINGSAKCFWYFLPLVPLLPRLVLVLILRPELWRLLGEDERDTDAHRETALMLASFSITFVAGLAVVGGLLVKDLLPAIYYAAVSFFCFLTTASLQEHKFYYWIDQLSDGLLETAYSLLALSAVWLLAAVYSWSSGPVIVVIVIASVAMVGFIGARLIADAQFWRANRGHNGDQ